MNYQQFYKSAAPKWVSNVSGWVDKNIRQPVQKGFVQPVQKVVNNSRHGVINSFSPVKDHVDYVMKTIPNSMVNEVGKGYQEYYQPNSIDHLNPLRATGLVLGGVADRWNHDYSTNTDGTPNTDKPTFFSTVSDAARNMTRNLSFASDMPGTTRLPWIGETKNSTIANVGALPASVAMYSDMMLPKSWTAKIIPKINAKNPVPIANMSDAKKYRIYKEIEHQKAKLYRDYMSTKPLHKEFEAIPQDPRNPITFNQYLNKRRPERWAEYVAKNKELSEKQGLLYPWLDNGGKFTYRTGTGSHLTRAGNYDTFGARLDTYAPMWKDPDAIIWRDIGRYGHMFPRFLMRMHRDGRWNTGKEQAKSFVSDAAGDYMSNLLTWGGSEMILPAIGDRINPAIGAALRRAAPGIRNASNTYLMYANQRDAFKNAIGAAPEEYLPLPNFRSYFSEKLHHAANSIPTLDDLMSGAASPDAPENQAIYIPGRVNYPVQ